MDSADSNKPRLKSAERGFLPFWHGTLTLMCLLIFVGFSNILQTKILVAEEIDAHVKQQSLRRTSGKHWPSSPAMRAAALNHYPTIDQLLPTCDFHLDDIDPTCPRFVDIRFRWFERAGLGDRFFQLMVGLTYALHLNAFLVNMDAEMGANSTHGAYDWVPDFFQINYINLNMTREVVKEQYGNLTVVERVEEYGETYKERIQALRSHCYTIIEVDNDDCIGGWECYFSHDPKIYEHMRNIMGCWFLHTDRSQLPPLIFDSAWYNVAIHLRVGDVVLLDGDQGKNYFTKLKSQLDIILTFAPVHYFFFAEAPGELAHERSIPPLGFSFLADLFGSRAHGGDDSAFPQRQVSFIKDMVVKDTLYHHMNADMVIATGSSFPLVAVTVSSKPVVLFSKSKEGDFYPTQMRADYAVIGDDGSILSPTIAELSAQVLMRFLEVHEKKVPYGG